MSNPPWFEFGPLHWLEAEKISFHLGLPHPKSFFQHFTQNAQDSYKSEGHLQI
jgi:hypothetical protein